MVKKNLLILSAMTLFATWSSAAGLSTILSADIAQYRQAFDGFQDAVRERKGVVANVEHVLGKETGESIMLGIGAEKPEVVFVIGSTAAQFGKARIRNIPVVFAMVLQPHPLAGDNVTGVALDISGRFKLEQIRRVLPDARRIGVIYSPASAALYRDVEQGCRTLGLQAVGRDIRSGKDLPEAFGEMVDRIDLFLMLPDAAIYFSNSIEFLLKEALMSRIPVVGLAASYTRAGALVSFDADYRDLGRQAGEMAVRIIDGELPQNMEPSRPRKIKTSLNLVVAERLGIKIDPQVIREASEVFK